MTMTPHETGVVDPSILSVDAADFGETFSSAAVPNDVAGQNVIDQLTEEEQAYADADPEADQSETHSAAVSVTSTGNDVATIGHNQVATPEEMRREVFRDINRLGKASGEGASALGRLGLRALRAASDGVLSTAKPLGGGKDDATLVYEAYAAMDSKHSEHTAGGAKANASKLRQIIGMGCMTTISDPVAIGDRVVRIRDAMEAAELKPKALFAGLVDVAREQQGSDTELTDEAISGCLTKTKADKTLEKEWEAIQKRIDGLVTGEGSSGLKDQSDGALQIAKMVNEHIKAFKMDGARNDLIDALMEQGYTHAMAVSIVDKKL